jgi:hypothetical protein
MLRWLGPLLLCTVIAGCPGGGGGPRDAGGAPRDGGEATLDVPSADVPTADVPTADAGLHDAAVIDGGSTDAGTSDAGAADAEADASEDAGGPTSCPPPPACDAPLPALSERVDWRHPIATGFTVAMGSARHRGRDLILREGEAQWALAKFAYGAADDDLKDEDVEVWLDRGCTGAWEQLDVVSTTDDGDHPTIEGVEDTGGRVYLPIPTAARLGLGRHRVVFVVRGDHTTAEQFIDVLPSSARIVVTDVDGTQTESETAEWATLLGAPGPDPQPSGAELLRTLVDRGFHVFYLTARPEWLEPRTRAWLREHGYPEGTVHTTLGGTGALGSSAETFKTDELAMLEAHVPGSLTLAIGNTDTDIAAYVSAGLLPARIVSYRYDAGAVATRVDDYATLIDDAAAEPIDCH